MRLIDADELRKKFYNYTTESGIQVSLDRYAVSCIDNAPTVDAVERKKGEWIFEPKDAIELMFTKPKCSNCGYESADGGNFCSNCGADMRGEANER